MLLFYIIPCYVYGLLVVTESSITVSGRFRQVLQVVSQLEGTGGLTISHRLMHRLSFGGGLGEWGPRGANHLPNLSSAVFGLHTPRPL